jgi:hypothetical protein
MLRTEVHDNYCVRVALPSADRIPIFPHLPHLPHLPLATTITVIASRYDEAILSQTDDPKQDKGADEIASRACG